MSAKFMVTDLTICEAYVWTLELHRNKYGDRDFRWLHDNDFPVLYQLRRQLAEGWNTLSPHDRKAAGDYYEWRKKTLDTLAEQHDWTPGTRKLYASMLSILHQWTRHGQNEATKARLKELMDGAGLILQFLDHYQPSLYDGGNRAHHH